MVLVGGSYDGWTNAHLCITAPAARLGLDAWTTTYLRASQNRDGHADSAKSKALRAYLDGIEPIEPGSVVGQQPQQQRVAGLHRPQRVQADRGLRADAPDEALDRAVSADDRVVTGPHAGRALGPDHGR